MPGSGSRGGAQKGERAFGCHVSSSGGIANAIRAGMTLGVNSIQIHPSPPQRWNSKAFDAGLENEFLELRKDSGISKVFFHAIYLINLANPDPQQFHLSKNSLVHYLNFNDRLQADGVIFHVGSNKDQPSEELGFARAAEGINWILEQTDAKVPLLLEVAAGSGAIIGDRLEELATIYKQVDQKKRVGFALDTQHMWASGYDWQSQLDSIVGQVDSILGLENIHAIHFNDSKTECGSKKDRHENIGDGLIGMEAMTAIFMHPKLASIPFILETPCMKDIESAKIDVEKLRSMIG